MFSVNSISTHPTVVEIFWTKWRAWLKIKPSISFPVSVKAICGQTISTQLAFSIKQVTVNPLRSLASGYINKVD